MNDFFTNQVSHGPHLGLFTHLGLLLLLFILLYLTTQYYTKTWFNRLFWTILLFQVVSLYTWYVWADFPLSESFPFYHCRLAILVLLFGKPGAIKRYFAYLGLFGSVLAFLHPVFDPYPFPHLTFFTYVVGHYALAVNALVYLLGEQSFDRLSLKQILSWTLLMNSVIFMVNVFTGGNYGFLSHLPLVNSQIASLNFFVVNLGLVLAIEMTQVAFLSYWKKHDGFILQE
ncbi:TPA: TIGR02206 family membrane protein [Streptococcus suis]|nr:TIGR02206 family membrane protein [Streptococcus suis]